MAGGFYLEKRSSIQKNIFFFKPVIFYPLGSLKLLWLELIFHRRIAYTSTVRVICCVCTDFLFRPTEHGTCRRENESEGVSVCVCVSMCL